MVLLLALCVVAALAAPSPVPYKDCSPKVHHMAVKSVTADPWPPVKGSNFEIVAHGVVDEVVDAGTFSADVYYLGMKIYSQTGKICELKDVKCPIQPGDFDITKDITFPSEAPSGAYTIQAYAKDQKGEYLTCAQFDMKVKSNGFMLAPHANLAADNDSKSEICHDFLKGFFQGLNRDGKDLIDHLDDPTKYLDRDALFNFIQALKDVKAHPTQVSGYVNAFQTASKLLTELQQAYQAVVGLKDSDKFTAFVAHLKSMKMLKDLTITLVVDPMFMQDVRELIQVAGCVKTGDCTWSSVGLKLGELLHTIMAHVQAILCRIK